MRDAVYTIFFIISLSKYACCDGSILRAVFYSTAR